MPVVGKENTLVYDIWGERNYFYMTVTTLTSRDDDIGFSSGMELTAVNKILASDEPLFVNVPFFPVNYIQWEAENGTLTGATAIVQSDALAYNQKVVQLGAANDEVQVDIDYFEAVLPAGKYHLAVRTWMTGVTGDETLNVMVVEDDYATGTEIYNQDHTIPIESAYGKSWIVIEDVDFDFRAGEHKYEFVFKRTTSGVAEPMFVDCFILIPVERSAVTGQKEIPLHFTEGELGIATVALKKATQRPSKDKRRGTT